MNKIKIFIWVIVISAIVYLVIVPAIDCLLRNLSPAPDIVYSIKEAKKKRILSGEYKIIPDKFLLPDGKVISFIEVWTEIPWHYSNKCTETAILNSPPHNTCLLNIRFNKGALAFLNNNFQYCIWGFRKPGEQDMKMVYIMRNDQVRCDIDSLGNYEKINFELIPSDVGKKDTVLQTFTLIRK